MQRVFALVLAMLPAACSSPAQLSIDVTAGQETGAFSVAPAVTHLEVTVTSLDQSVQVKASAVPGGTFDLGNLPADAWIGVEMRGVAADGAVVMRGRSLYGLPLGSLEGDLPVLALRVNQWTRPAGGLVQTHVGGVAASLGERYLLVTGGTKAEKDTGAFDPAQADYYDLLSLGGAFPTVLPRAAQTLVSLGDVVLLIDAHGASFVNYATGSVTEATWPEALGAFADVAGGAVIRASNGRTFVVGATRTGTASAAVLEVDDSQSLHAFRLATPRKGAAAVWLNEIGVVVAGGSLDPSSHGIEVLAEGATMFVPRGAPADAVEGAGAVSDGGPGIVLVGGVLHGAPAPTRRVDPACLTNCAAQVLAVASLPVALSGVVAYALGGGRLIVVGDELGGAAMTRVFVVEPTVAPVALALKEPRRGAIPVPTPLAHLALVGGEHLDGTPATSVEMLFTQ